MEFANNSPLIEKISKGRSEGFQAKAAQVIDLLPEKEQVRIMISNMSRQYHDSFYFQAMTIYDSLMGKQSSLLTRWPSRLRGKADRFSVSRGRKKLNQEMFRQPEFDLLRELIQGRPRHKVANAFRYAVRTRRKHRVAHPLLGETSQSIQLGCP